MQGEKLGGIVMEETMPEQPQISADRQPPPAAQAVETPPSPAAADVPPEARLTEDQLDSIENSRRKIGDRWGTDLVLLFLYIVASTVLIAAILFVRHHIHR